MLVAQPHGHFHFLVGIDPYSCGVIADDGFEIVRTTLSTPMPWREGLDRVADYLQQLGLSRHALCAMELRSPQPFTMGGFIEFNKQYCAVLKSWGLLIDGLNPLARTNVCPVADPPQETSLHAFCTVRPNASIAQKTLVVAGAGELRDGELVDGGILRCGETSRSAMLEKATYVMRVMEERLRRLGGDWHLIKSVDLYTSHPIDEILQQVVLPSMFVARRWGTHWYQARPPVVDIEFEMDMRGVATELVVDP